jgi:hypothetical protein
MKFFKHFTDAHEGHTLSTLFEQMGHMGPSCYWTLVELCAKKLEKEDHEEFTEAHCQFRFHERVLRTKLRVSPRNLRKFLNICSELSQVFSSFAKNTVEINFPKLLESLDRDSKRARQERGLPAPKKKIKNKNKETDVAFLNWREEALNIQAMLAKYGDWSKSEAEVRDHLGDTVFNLACRAGTHKMRMLPPNSFSVPAIIGMLKDANNQLRLTGVHE